MAARSPAEDRAAIAANLARFRRAGASGAGLTAASVAMCVVFRGRRARPC